MADIANTTALEPSSDRVELQSPLLRLPPELRNRITELCLVSSNAIVNPSPLTSANAKTPLLIRPKHQSIPALGTALLRTCRQLHFEIDFRPLYAGNTICFTRITHLTSFVRSLAYDKRHLIDHLTLDLREASVCCNTTRGYSSDPVVLEMTHFLSCSLMSAGHVPGIWCCGLSTLKSDRLNITSLTIDLHGLSDVVPNDMGVRGYKCGSVIVLAQMLKRIKGLKLLEIVGQKGDLWDLVNVSKPMIYGEWATIEGWLDMVGRLLMPFMRQAVCCDDRAGDEEHWSGWVWNDQKIALQAHHRCPTMVPAGYDNMCSWEQCLKQTEDRNRSGLPVFKLFI